MERIKMEDMKKKTLEFVEDHKRTIAEGIGLAAVCGVWYLVGYTKASKDFKMSIRPTKDFCKEVLGAVRHDDVPIKPLAFKNTDFAGRNLMDTAVDILSDSEARKAISGVVILTEKTAENTQN